MWALRLFKWRTTRSGQSWATFMTFNYESNWTKAKSHECPGSQTMFRSLVKLFCKHWESKMEEIQLASFSHTESRSDCVSPPIAKGFLISLFWHCIVSCCRPEHPLVWHQEGALQLAADSEGPRCGLERPGCLLHPWRTARPLLQLVWLQ